MFPSICINQTVEQLDTVFSKDSNAGILACVQGAGGFGEVYECSWRGRRVAVKKLPGLQAPSSAGGEQHAALVQEVQLSCRFTSDRLVSLAGAQRLVCRQGVCSGFCGTLL